MEFCCCCVGANKMEYEEIVTTPQINDGIGKTNAEESSSRKVLLLVRNGNVNVTSTTSCVHCACASFAFMKYKSFARYAVRLCHRSTTNVRSVQIDRFTSHGIPTESISSEICPRFVVWIESGNSFIATNYSALVHINRMQM